MLNIGQVGAAGFNEHLMQKLGWQMVNLPMETKNAFANWYLAYASEYPDSVETMRELLELAPGRIKCVSELKKGSGPIVVIGSGSSLDDVVPTLKDWKGAVMCSTSQASTLVKHGRYPDYIVCLDPRVAPQDELAAPDWGTSVLLGHVSIPALYVIRWLQRATTPMYLGRLMEPSYDWYSHHLAQGYSWIKHIIMPMIDSGASEIGFATWLGYSPIYITGIDYGGPRFDRWDWNYDTKTWSLDTVTSKVNAVNEHRTFCGLTAVRAMSYASRGTMLSSFMQMANAKYKQRIYQLSDRSDLKQFPKREWSSVLSGAPETEEYDYKGIMEDLEMALAVWDTFLVPLHGGWGLDYHTYIANKEEGFDSALRAYNNQVLSNLADFGRIEKEHKQPVREMVAKGQITVEAGDLLLHGSEEFHDWDWHKIKPVDIPAILMRRRWLLEEADKRGYKSGGPAPEVLMEKWQKEVGSFE